MKFYLLLLLSIALTSCLSISHSKFAEQIKKHRAEYQNDFLQTDRSPLELEDIQFLDYFPADRKYLVKARVELLDQQDTLALNTSAGKIKHYLPYALLKFSLYGQKLQLYAYTSLDLKNNEAYKDYLFIPFTDETNGEESYGGGRYLDLNKNDIHQHHIKIDFNKAYNPWCAFSEGYNCPIPPRANDLPIRIKAGEKKFKASVKKR